jgi:hypothetical protein
MSPSSGLQSKPRKQPAREWQRKNCFLDTNLLESANSVGFKDV